MSNKEHWLIRAAEKAINDKRFNRDTHENELFYQFLGAIEYVLESNFKDSEKVEMINEDKMLLREALEIIKESDLKY